jgi:hypothetical protein
MQGDCECWDASSVRVLSNDKGEATPFLNKNSPHVTLSPSSASLSPDMRIPTFPHAALTPTPSYAASMSSSKHREDQHADRGDSLQASSRPAAHIQRKPGASVEVHSARSIPRAVRWPLRTCRSARPWSWPPRCWRRRRRPRTASRTPSASSSSSGTPPSDWTTEQTLTRPVRHPRRVYSHPLPDPSFTTAEWGCTLNPQLRASLRSHSVSTLRRLLHWLSPCPLPPPLRQRDRPGSVGGEQPHCAHGSQPQQLSAT